MTRLVRKFGPAELGDLSRFEHPRQLMAFAGLPPREHSSGSRQQRGGITKTGNAQLRHVLIEAAWHSRHQAKLSGPLKLRQRDQPAPVTAITWTAQTRLHRRYSRLLQRNKLKQHVVVAVARELLALSGKSPKPSARWPPLGLSTHASTRHRRITVARTAEEWRTGRSVLGMPIAVRLRPQPAFGERGSSRRILVLRWRVPPSQARVYQRDQPSYALRSSAVPATIVIGARCTTT